MVTPTPHYRPLALAGVMGCPQGTNLFGTPAAIMEWRGALNWSRVELCRCIEHRRNPRLISTFKGTPDRCFCHSSIDPMANLIIQTWTKGMTKARWVKIFIAIAGTYYHFNFTKYRRRYLAEAHYRISRCFDLALLVGRSFTPARAPHPAPSAGCGSRRS